MEHAGDGDTNCKWCTWNKPQTIGKETKRFRNLRTNRDLPDFGQNNERSPGDLTRLDDTKKKTKKKKTKKKKPNH